VSVFVIPHSLSTVGKELSPRLHVQQRNDTVYCVWATSGGREPESKTAHTRTL